MGERADGGPPEGDDGDGTGGGPGRDEDGTTGGVPGRNEDGTTGGVPGRNGGDGTEGGPGRNEDEATGGEPGPNASQRGGDDHHPDPSGRMEDLVDPDLGIVTDVRRVAVPPDEPQVYSYVVVREEFAPFTDGVAMPHEEGGCAFAQREAVTAAVGEAVERYCGCVYRDADLTRGAYADLDGPAVDPTRVVNFSDRQVRDAGLGDRLCTRDDEIAWVRGQHLGTGEAAWVPAQLVYLSYPPGREPFVRNPITTGLAAGDSRSMALRGGLYELVERDAFVTYYLTETELPRVDLEGAPRPVRRVRERVRAHDLELHVLDATTEFGVPVAVAAVVDRSARPAVTVAASAGTDPAGVVRDATAEAMQARLSTVHLLADRRPGDVDPATIESYEERCLLWAPHRRLDDLAFWLETDRETTFDDFGADAPEGVDGVVGRLTDAGHDVYAADVTTRDVASLGFRAFRTVVPRLQPLYLVERLRYWGGDRLYETPVAMGYRDAPPAESELNEVPHPFP